MSHAVQYLREKEWSVKPWNRCPECGGFKDHLFEKLPNGHSQSCQIALALDELDEEVVWRDYTPEKR